MNLNTQKHGNKYCHDSWMIASCWISRAVNLIESRNCVTFTNKTLQNNAFRFICFAVPVSFVADCTCNMWQSRQRETKPGDPPCPYTGLSAVNFEISAICRHFLLFAIGNRVRTLHTKHWAGSRNPSWP